MILRDLLALIASGQALSLEDAAARLNISKPLAEDMVKKMTELGYLEDPSQCTDSCSSCDSGNCILVAHRKAWRLTEKGRQVLGRS